MQRPERQVDVDRLSPARKGHVPQISISDDRHHITEAIGSYYDDDEDSNIDNASLNMASPVHDMRPLSFIPSQRDSISHGSDMRSKRQGTFFNSTPNGHSSPPRTPNSPITQTYDRQPPGADDDSKSSGSSSSNNASPKSLRRMGSLGADSSINGNAHGQPSPPPPMSRQTSAEMAFPLNDIDYESSPAAVAQELSNLQAIRRMSMNVDTADPDLPSFGAAFGTIPSVAPKNSDDEDDPSKLFWVPARLHPELAPKEFKTFIEDRVDKIRRRSGGEDSLSPDGLERAGSNSSLRRKKSMLSHQIDTRGNYQDGAERLERKRSKGMQLEGQATVANLADLEQLVNDPAQLVRRMSLDTSRTSLDSGVDMPPNEDDMPILPPVGTLKRSTRTTYRRGSLKKGERVPFSRRAQQRQSETDTEETPVQSPIASSADEPILGLTRVQTDPTASTSTTREMQRDPSLRRKKVPEPSRYQERSSLEQGVREAISPPQPSAREEERYEEPREERYDEGPSEERRSEEHSRLQPRPFQSRIASQGRTTAQLPGYNNTNPLPQIIETLPDGTKVPAQSLLQGLPARKSSHELARPYQRPPAQMRSIPGRQPHYNTTLDDISSRPSPLPGSGGTSTDALTMVPTFDERKFEKREGSKKSSWKWILGNDGDDDKKSKDDRSSDSSTKSKSKQAKLSQDKARLDVLQNSIDGTTPIRGRESLVLNREDIQLDDERSKQGKKFVDRLRQDKDKEPGLLSAIFGGKKKSSDSEAKDRKRRPDRNLSPEPPPRILKPDIDYNWTRFSILEERAIYRMAHIKLANPRRALYSQVLLSNFMYSYLAKVQMMHPHMQIPGSHKASQRDQKSEEQQPPEFSQYQRWQEQQARQDAASNAQDEHSARSSFDTSNDSSASHRSNLDDVGDQSYSGYDRRRSEDFNRNAYSSQPGASGSNGMSGYSVASTNDYLGYARDEQPFGQPGLWDDEEKEDLW